MTLSSTGPNAWEAAETAGGRRVQGVYARQPADARETVSVTIASGEALTAPIDLGGATLAGIVIPATWTAAGLTFRVSVDGETFFDLYADGAEVTVAGTAGKMHALDIGDWLAWRHIEIRSGTTGTPVNQGAERTLILALVW